jgi:transcriptional regulator with PAS, ATPase and Fis domain
VVGHSRVTREIVDLVQRIAKRPATVLVLGESGTGKELLARLIHRQAGDPGAPFVAVNLAAIPKELIESTLFGHEKGSFTGAIKQQIGKFELASGGTLFLDEVGDLRLDLQAKLLRAIQEGEIERVGGTHPIKTSFRLIAATNVDLDKAVREGRFREDLYFRLNIIPIRMPALRDRIEDLPELANFFLRRYNVKLPAQRAGHRRVHAEDPGGALVAGQHPRAREPDRTPGGGDREGLDYRRGSALRLPGQSRRLRRRRRRRATGSTRRWTPSRATT